MISFGAPSDIEQPFVLILNFFPCDSDGFGRSHEETIRECGMSQKITLQFGSNKEGAGDRLD
jgi:hypothetical protein